MFTSSSVPGVRRLWPVRLMALPKAGGFRGTDVYASLTSPSPVANGDSSGRSCYTRSNLTRLLSNDRRGCATGGDVVVVGIVVIARHTGGSTVPLTSIHTNSCCTRSAGGMCVVSSDGAPASVPAAIPAPAVEAAVAVVPLVAGGAIAEKWEAESSPVQAP